MAVTALFVSPPSEDVNLKLKYKNKLILVRSFYKY